MNNIQSKIENRVVKSNVINNEIMKEINKSNSKEQIIKGTDISFIYEIQIGLGAEHDFHLFKRTFEGTPVNVTYTVDLGYLGVTKIHSNCKIPKKKSKTHPLTEEEKNTTKK